MVLIVEAACPACVCNENHPYRRIIAVRTGVRIYLTESMGGVLGANVMRDHNVVFDYDNHLVGFAEGICDYRADATPEGNAAEVCVVYRRH